MTIYIGNLKETPWAENDKLDIPQGTLELMILTVLTHEPMHGYGISQRAGGP